MLVETSHSKQWLQRVALAAAVLLALLAILAIKDAAPARAANGSCTGPWEGLFDCEWNCNPQAATSWCWFDSGGTNARNWVDNSVEDFYSSHVWKCAAMVRADNGNTYSSNCNSNQITWNIPGGPCNCGGVYVRSWNNATSSRNLYSHGQS
jgi:hypothetical protein